MLTTRTYTLNAICGLIQNRAEVKALFAPYEPIHWPAMARNIAIEFCCTHGLAFARDLNIPDLEQHDPDWDEVAVVARALAGAD